MSAILFFNQFFRPTTEEMMNIEELFASGDGNLAIAAGQATFPFLRELGNFFADGGQFPQPPGKILACVMLKYYILIIICIIICIT